MARKFEFVPSASFGLCAVFLAKAGNIGPDTAFPLCNLRHTVLLVLLQMAETRFGIPGCPSWCAAGHLPSNDDRHFRRSSTVSSDADVRGCWRILS